MMKSLDEENCNLVDTLHHMKNKLESNSMASKWY